MHKATANRIRQEAIAQLAAPVLDYQIHPTNIEFFDARTGHTIKRGKLHKGETWHSCYNRLMRPKPWISIRKVGGIWHWRIGPIGGSLYMAKGR